MPTPLKSSPLHSFLMRLLLSSLWWWKIPGLKQLWQALWKWNAKSPQLLAEIDYLGYRILVNNGNQALLTYARYKEFNQPIIKAVKLAHKLKNRKVTYLDIGVAFGDTPLMVERQAGPYLKEIVCIDGDDRFFSILSENLKQLVTPHKEIKMMLSEKMEKAPALVWDRASTASSQGKELVEAQTLDYVFQAHGIVPDVIKIDVDGFDGRILAGGTETLAKHRPVVIFEWNPALYAQCGSRQLQPFEVLAEAGYSRLAWFTNFGPFSHYTTKLDILGLEALGAFCIANYGINGYHFDVLAIADEAEINLEEVN